VVVVVAVVAVVAVAAAPARQGHQAPRGKARSLIKPTRLLTAPRRPSQETLPPQNRPPWCSPPKRLCVSRD
jgi:hypothetical protein